MVPLPLINDYMQSTVSLYLQDVFTPNEAWKFNGGVRVNYFSKGNYWRIAPRLSIDHFYSTNIRLQAAYGRYYQFLSLVSNEAFSGFDAWYTIAENIDPPWGDQFILGAKTIPFDGYGFDVELYYRTMNDLFELDPRITDQAGLAYEDIFRFGKRICLWCRVLFLKNE